MGILKRPLTWAMASVLTLGVGAGQAWGLPGYALCGAVLVFMAVWWDH